MNILWPITASILAVYFVFAAESARASENTGCFAILLTIAACILWPWWYFAG